MWIAFRYVVTWELDLEAAYNEKYPVENHDETPRDIFRCHIGNVVPV